MSFPTTNSSLTLELLKTRSRAIMEVLCNQRDPNFTVARTLLHPALQMEHDDYPTTSDLEAYLTMFSEVLTSVPDFGCVVHTEIAELASNEERQNGIGGRCWVFSTITGLQDGVEKYSVDMMVFDNQGLAIKLKDVQREIGK
nr:uncharacterized protein CI109_004317 [Kwoniella shandongensis]KAA5527257.1 hypothetical protein CI109_004317 [Kwoniella shandongensis]